MTEISSLLEGNDMQKDCAYHLLQYRFVQYPSILKSPRNLDDVQTVSSFVQSVAFNDLMVMDSIALWIDCIVTHSPGGCCNKHCCVPGAVACFRSIVSGSAMRQSYSKLGRICENCVRSTDRAYSHQIPETWLCTWSVIYREEWDSMQWLGASDFPSGRVSAGYQATYQTNRPLSH